MGKAGFNNRVASLLNMNGILSMYRGLTIVLVAG